MAASPVSHLQKVDRSRQTAHLAIALRHRAYFPTASSEFSRVPPSSVPPRVLEPVGRHFGISNGVLDVLVPEVVLQGSRIVAIVGQLKPTGMAKHVWVDREWHLGGLPEALDESVETD